MEPTKGNPAIFDECWVRVQVNGGSMIVCPGLVMGWADGSFYLPFHYVRIAGFWVEDEPIGPGKRFTWTIGPLTRTNRDIMKGAPSFKSPSPRSGSWKKAQQHQH
jgi:hypothetical protein